MPKQKIDELFEAIVDFSGLKDFIDQPLKTYSSGMRSRLGFSVACETNPDVLLIDETLSAGDAEFVEKSAARIKSMVNGAHTVFIEKGEILANGPVRDVINFHLHGTPMPDQPPTT